MKKMKIFVRTVIVLLISNIVFCCMTGCAEEEKDDLTVFSLSSQENSAREESADEVQNEDTDLTASDEESKDTIFVYVCGAVEKPGVYELSARARVFEALACAGGLKEDADEDYLNQAQVLTDGEQIYVPTKEEAQEKNLSKSTSGTESGITADGKVNINLATKEELMTLNGIGESRAESILTYRESKGDFQKIEDLMKVDGIKEGIYEKIKDSITVTTGS